VTPAITPRPRRPVRPTARPGRPLPGCRPSPGNGLGRAVRGVVGGAGAASGAEFLVLPPPRPASFPPAQSSSGNAPQFPGARRRYLAFPGEVNPRHARI
jgi:hypothetical protein